MLFKLPIAILAVSVLFGGLIMYAQQHQHAPLQSLQELGLTCKNKPQLCVADVGQLPLERAPNRLVKSGRWNLAAQSPNLGEESPLQFKRWNYVSFAGDRYFIAAAMVKLFYISDVFLYVVDRETRERYEYTGRMPFGVGLSQYMTSSVENCSKWGVPKKNLTTTGEFRPWMELCAKPGGGYRFRANVPVTSKESKHIQHLLAVDITANSGVDLILAFPLAGDEARLAYVHKLAGMPVQRAVSYVRFDDAAPVAMENAAGALDWTKGRMLYRTAWKWVSFNDAHAKVNGKQVVFGINLSNEVYDVENEHGDAVSAENAIWLDGKMFALTGRVEITPGEHEWSIKSTRPTQDEALDLKFTPWGAREDHSNFHIIVSDFVQPFGGFTGAVRVHGIDVEIDKNAFGVVENHLAYW